MLYTIAISVLLEIDTIRSKGARFKGLKVL